MNYILLSPQIIKMIWGLYAATAPDVQGGEYFGPSHLELRGVESSLLSHDEAAARRLWEVSEEMTVVGYGFGAGI
ncbi:hypothetical protein MKZ15_01265 [Paenibacillus sp. FSL R7-0216]|uniref:hypothetical protein n=1 Tax=Paenibacillus sp. FSL R7-0216 TaxID=2921677 RepID=UPI0030DA4FD1